LKTTGEGHRIPFGTDIGTDTKTNTGGKTNIGKGQKFGAIGEVAYGKKVPEDPKNPPVQFKEE
jgi:hypothetical protein